MATIKVTCVGSDLAPKSNRLSLVGRVTAARWRPRCSSHHVAVMNGDLFRISDVGNSEWPSGRQREDEQVLTEVVGGPVRMNLLVRGSEGSRFSENLALRLQGQAHVGLAHLHAHDDGHVRVAAQRGLLLT